MQEQKLEIKCKVNVLKDEKTKRKNIYKWWEKYLDLKVKVNIIGMVKYTDKKRMVKLDI